tara:strand:+ start:1710 stop:2855 length:1146 start_codon:yes stop_codon:yes gene_type:complete
MTIKASGNPLAFTEIEAEFGGTPGRSFGKYRRDDPSFTNESPSGSSLSGLPLDTGIPTSGEIKFSQFYGKKLNMVIDYYADTANLNKAAAGNNTMAATWRYQNQSERVKIVGGYRSRPLGSVAANYALTASDWQGGKKVFINVNQTIGGKKPSMNNVALRTGNWPTGTELRVDVGPSGYITGAGGDGGATSPGTSSNAFPGNNGTSALGIEYPAAINNGGVIRCGYGGGGGGSGAADDPSDKSDTDYGRTGGGGGGGAGLPAGNGGAGGPGGSFNGPDPKDGQPGDAGTLTTGGSGGVSYPYEGANAGAGGDGGDFGGAAEPGVKGTQGRGVGYSAPGNEGAAGNDGKAIYYSSSSVQSGSTFSGNTIGGRNGGSTTGFFT